jgi:hypothetical protein
MREIATQATIAWKHPPGAGYRKVSPLWEVLQQYWTVGQKRGSINSTEGVGGTLGNSTEGS